MEDLSDIECRSLRSLSSFTRILLSNLLNSTKVLPTEGPIARHRDWRGLASLVNISTEVEATIWGYNDKIGKVLEIWMESQGGTVGELLRHLVTLDRFDVYDDIIDSIREQMQIRPENQVALPNNNQVQLPIVEDNEMITFDDRPGHIHRYHAYLLYAEQDHEFVNELRRVLSSHGFEICSNDDLLPGHASQYPPVARLISERCQRIILVYSPDFLKSHDNSFFRDYAQAVSIERDQRKLLPIMYRKCDLPLHLRPYHNLYYNCGLNNFWQRLIISLDNTRLPCVNGIPAHTPQVNVQSVTHSAVNIQTMQASTANSDDDSRFFLSPRSAPMESLTPGNVSLATSNVSLATSNVSLPPSISLASLQINTTDNLLKPVKKKKNKVKKLLNVFSPSSYRKKK